LTEGVDTPVHQRISQVIAPTPPRWSIAEILWVALIAAAAFQLRTIDYPVRPALSNNWDEFAFAWSGLTLITRGVPYGWSFLPHYAVVTQFVSNGITFPLVHPFLDHPPLFSLLVGAEAWLFGARDLGDVTTAMTRPLAITLGALSVPLMYALARRVLPAGAAVIGTVLFATAPVAVLLGRVAESEALLSPLLLLALLLVTRVLSGEAGRWTMAAIATCCAAATLTKVPGLATGLACAAVLAAGGRSRLALYPLGGAVAGLALYVGYGWLIDWKQFLAVISDQAARREGVLGAYEFVASPAGIGGTLRDGWWLLGWAGLAAVGLRYRQGLRLLLWPVLTVALVIMLLGGESLVARYGWYRIYIYPIVYLGAGYACWEAVRTAALGWVAAVLMLGAATTVSLAVGYGIPGSGPPAVAVETVALLVLGSALVAEGRRQTPWVMRVARGVSAGVVALALIGNILESAMMSSLKQPF
jgi:4-amino-4-deoxy-L-arabinose transferase-like glycosyltransferase